MWFLTCIQVSQEAGQVVWYSHLFQNFPQFIVIHTVKCFGIVNKAEINVWVFLELSCFFNDPADVGNLISCSWPFLDLVSWPFLKPAGACGSSLFTYCWCSWLWIDLCPVHYNSNMKYISDRMLSRKIIATLSISGVEKSWKIISKSFKYFGKQ